MATFTAETATDFGFSIIRHADALQFDAEYIFMPETDGIFS